MTRIDLLDLPRVYPSGHALALAQAAMIGDHEAIDRITDELAAMGICRPRSDDSVFQTASQSVETQSETEPK